MNPLDERAATGFREAIAGLDSGKFDPIRQADQAIASAVQEFELGDVMGQRTAAARSEEHTSELQSRQYLVCRLLLEKKKPLLLERLQRTHLDLEKALPYRLGLLVVYDPALPLPHCVDHAPHTVPELLAHLVALYCRQ